ncbi:MAG: hypothetical protein Q8K69_05340 [Bacteroidota bacterium]|nr:hypothetical protein [Bacteroidota bacterium]
MKVEYILNQAVHHRKVSYMEEYDAFIKFFRKTIATLNDVKFGLILKLAIFA